MLKFWYPSTVAKSDFILWLIEGWPAKRVYGYLVWRYCLFAVTQISSHNSQWLNLLQLSGYRSFPLACLTRFLEFSKIMVRLAHVIIVSFPGKCTVSSRAFTNE